MMYSKKVLEMASTESHMNALKYAIKTLFVLKGILIFSRLSGGLEGGKWAHVILAEMVGRRVL